ncbi:hypothetical protein BV898_03636 [Hypsibius exemplaris]|uniref:Uncharacterized protein n=1 Tax=Hypsibius exemplaris TaxID=2072580 RepID=A0A1W0X4S7_HYPEX|nr:hypothetical protein BV898_03636 [Hypsibius exemplaris]
MGAGRGVLPGSPLLAERLGETATEERHGGDEGRTGLSVVVRGRAGGGGGVVVGRTVGEAGVVRGRAVEVDPVAVTVLPLLMEDGGTSS